MNERYRVVVDSTHGFLFETYTDELSHAKKILEAALRRYGKPADTRLEQLTDDGHSYRLLTQHRKVPTP